MKLFLDEVKNMIELKEKLNENDNIQQEYKVAVIVYAFDEDNRIIFQRRGPGCRDERFKLKQLVAE